MASSGNRWRAQAYPVLGMCSLPRRVHWTAVPPAAASASPPFHLKLHSPHTPSQGELEAACACKSSNRSEGERPSWTVNSLNRADRQGPQGDWGSHTRKWTRPRTWQGVEAEQPGHHPHCHLPAKEGKLIEGLGGRGCVGTRLPLHSAAHAEAVYRSPSCALVSPPQGLASCW